MTKSYSQPNSALSPSQTPEQSFPKTDETIGKRKGSRLFIVFAIGILALFILLFVLVPISAFAYFQIYGIIVPGVSVGDLELGGLTWQQAKEGLDLVYGIDPELTLTDGERNWIAHASEFGLGWDTDAMAQGALNVGHGKDFLTEVEEIITSLRDGWEIEPVLVVDSDEIQRGLQSWERNIQIEPVNASLGLTGDELQVRPSKIGLGLDLPATVELVEQNPEAIFENGIIHLMTATILPEIPNVDEALEELERLLNREIYINAFDPIRNVKYEWFFEREGISSWISIEDTLNGPEIQIDPDSIRGAAETLNSSLDDDQYIEAEILAEILQNALYEEVEIKLLISHPQTSYLVQEGDTLLKLGWRMRMPYWMIMEANPELYDLGLQTGQNLTIPSLDDLIPLPVVLDKRIVMSISDQILWTYENGQLLDEYIISTGIDRSPTQPGVFQVQTHELNAYASVWDLYMPHFLGIYEAWPDFMNGLHGLPTLSNGRRLWADILGRPASFGCIILDLDAAESLYEWAEDGVVVEILE